MFCPSASESAWGQTGGISVVPTISTIAGNGSAGYGGDGGPAVDGSLNGPSATAVDKQGNVYIADTYDSRIRKIDTNGAISTVVGDGSCHFVGDNGPAVNASVCQPTGVAVDVAGNIFIADTQNHRIRKINTSGVISTLAGTGNCHFVGDGGPAVDASVCQPTGVAVDTAGNIYIADNGDYRVRKIDTSGIITTVAGNGQSGFSGDGSSALNAAFNTVASVAVDGAGNIYVADSYNTRIRKIDSSGVVTTIAGSSYGFSGDGGPAVNAQISNSFGVAADGSGNVYFVDTYNHRVRVISSSGTIGTIAGDGTGAFGGDGGPATQAQLNNPYGVAVDPDGNVYISDLNNQRIRKLGASNIPQPIPTFGAIPVAQSSTPIKVTLEVHQPLTITSLDVPPTEGRFAEYTLGAISGCSLGVAIPTGTTCTVSVTFTPGYPGLRAVPLVAVTTVGTFRFALVGIGLGAQVTISPGVIQTVAGSGSTTFSGDNGPATSAGMLTPSGVARDNAGNVYIATYDKRIRRVAPNGTITTVAGTGASCSDSTSACGDGGPATSATFIQPANIALDPAGNLYISDALALKVRKVDANGIITTVAGNGTPCSPTTACGDGGSATGASFAAPYGIAFDGKGNLYIADETGNRIRKVSVSGTITTIAGTGTQGFSGDNRPAISANLNNPFGVAVDVNGNVYFTDAGNQRIRKVDSKSGLITTLAGGGSSTSIPVEGVSATSVALSLPTGISLDPSGSIYVADFGSHAVDKVDAATATIRSIAGTQGSAGFSGDGGPATVAKLDQPVAVALDSFGAVYVADFTNNRVRQISATAAPVSFPDTPVGQTSASRSVYVSDIGNWDLSISQITTPADFVVDPSGTCVGLTSLASASTCIASALFAPQQSGPRTGTAVFIDDALNASNNTQTVTLNGNGSGLSTVTTLALSTSNTISPGTPVTLTANVAPNTAGSTTASGTISFYDGATLLQSPVSISSQGSASITVASFASGTHPLTAVYSGDTNFSTSTSPVINLTVNAATTVNLVASENPARYGDSVTFTASVPAGSTGSIQFRLGGNNVGSPVPLVAGKASMTSSALDVGAHVITAVYTDALTRGDTPSDNLVQLVEKAVLTVRANDISRSYGQPNGTLGYIITGFIPPDNEASSVTGTPLIVTDAIPAAPVGTYPIVTRQGSLASTSYTFQYVNGTVTVARATPSPTDIVLATSANPSVWGQAVRLSAQLPAHATGQVVFMDGPNALGTATIANSAASITTAQLAVGVHPITAVYGGDSNYLGATSSVLSQAVGKANLNVVATDQQRVYGQPNPPNAYTFSGFVNGDTAATAVTGTPNETTVATISSPVGGYPILVTAGSLASANYSFNFIQGTLSVTQAPTTTSLVLPSTAMYGDRVRVSATVSFASTTAQPPTGTVSLYADNVLLETLNLNSVNYQVLFNIGGLQAGTHSITAVYSGDGNWGTSTGAASINITQATPGLTVTVNDETRGATQTNPPFSYTVTGNFVNGDTADTAVSGGTFSSYTGTTPGSYPITVSGVASPNYALALVPGTLTVTNDAGSPTTTVLTATPTSSMYGDLVTLTGAVTTPNPGPPAISGTVNFYDGLSLVGRGTINNNIATLSITALGAGTHRILATYNGDGTYSSSRSTLVTVTVAKKQNPSGGAALTATVQDASRAFGQGNPDMSYTPSGTLVNGDTYDTAIGGIPLYLTIAGFTSPVGSTYPVAVTNLISRNYELTTVPGNLTIVAGVSTTALFASPTSTQYGDPVTLQVTVTPSVATGIVRFEEGTRLLGIAPLNGSGFAILKLTTLSAGSHDIVAQYVGDNNIGGSSSPAVNIIVAKKTDPSGGPALTVTANNATKQFEQRNPAFDYTVTGTLVNGDTYANAVTGQPNFTTTANLISPVGSYPIAISQLTSMNYVLSYANGTLTVTRNQSRTTLSAPPSSIVGTPVTLAATVSVGATGQVTFFDGTTQIGTGTVTNRFATLSVSSLIAGTHSITAVYGGDANYLSSTSTAAAIVVAPQSDFEITNKSPAQIIPPGASATFTIAVTSINSPFTNTVSLTAANLPPGATYSFTPASVIPGANGATTQLSVSVPRQTASRLRHTRIAVAFASAFFPLAFMRSYRKRRSGSLLWIVMALAVLGSVAGCGTGGYFSQSEQTYSIAVIGTSGGTVHSTQVSLTVE
jgi:sugar lactone lactonase YvrE